MLNKSYFTCFFLLFLIWLLENLKFPIWLAVGSRAFAHTSLQKGMEIWLEIGMYVCGDGEHILTSVHICNVSVCTRQEFSKCSTVSTPQIFYPVITPEGQMMSIHYDTCLWLIQYHLDVTCQSTLALLRGPLLTWLINTVLPNGYNLKGDKRMTPNRENSPLIQLRMHVRVKLGRTPH